MGVLNLMHHLLLLGNNNSVLNAVLFISSDTAKNTLVIYGRLFFLNLMKLVQNSFFDQFDGLGN